MKKRLLTLMSGMLIAAAASVNLYAEDGLHINLLVTQTGRPYSEVSSDLTMLELQGLVRSLPGGIYRFRS